MAWGCFCWIPCPYKKWKDEDRPAMLAMLPLLGAFMGAIVSALWLGLVLLGAGPQLVAAVVTAAAFLLTGFIHLDGYMDCCDAVLPRHPDMEKRREILKDPHNGAFAMISLVLMLLVYSASVYELTQHLILELQTINWTVLSIFPIVMTVSRGCSVSYVASKGPIRASQYADMTGERRKILLPLSIVVVLVAGALFIGGIAFGISNNAVFTSGIGGTALGATMAAAYIAGEWDIKALGGMNGDVSGHMIVTGEMFGLLVASLTAVMAAAGY